MAPFLARRIWNRAAFEIRLAECTACGFKFFNPRLEPDEERRLYSGYRDGIYRRQRHACEPWYTESFNRSLSGEAELGRRKACLRQILSEHRRPYSVSSLLDFGGASGELVQDLIPGAEAYVYDISEVEPAPGVQRLRSLEEGKARPFDLIVCSNVLEHVGYPRNLVDQLAQVVSPGGLAFLEVPCESPCGLSNFTKRMIQEFILFGTHPAIALTLLQRGTTQAMHEHVNFFRPAVLQRLLTARQWKVIATGTYKLGRMPFAGEMVWSLARRGSLPLTAAAGPG
jgi:2-polyprenyl-3-methyl-5-hydroxy-6-metoxy-1,4-benzoquinol methylase